MAMLPAMKRNEGKRTGGCNLQLLLHGLVLLLVVVPMVGWAQAPSFRWASRVDGTGVPENIYEVALDGAGDCFVTGYHQGAHLRAFLAKYDASGNVIWMQEPFLPSNTSIGVGVAADSAGNSYLAGLAGGT